MRMVTQARTMVPRNLRDGAPGVAETAWTERVAGLRLGVRVGVDAPDRFSRVDVDRGGSRLGVPNGIGVGQAGGVVAAGKATQRKVVRRSALGDGLLARKDHRERPRVAVGERELAKVAREGEGAARPVRIDPRLDDDAALIRNCAMVRQVDAEADRVATVDRLYVGCLTNSSDASVAVVALVPLDAARAKRTKRAPSRRGVVRVAWRLALLTSPLFRRRLDPFMTALVVEVKASAPLPSRLAPPAGGFGDRRERGGQAGDDDEDGDSSLHGSSSRLLTMREG